MLCCATVLLKLTSDFDVHVNVHRDKFVIIKPTRCSNFSIYFGKKLYMFRTDLQSIIRSLNTVFTVIVIFHTSYVDSLLARSGWNCKSVRNM